MKQVVVIGASAGGITALRMLLGQLPAEFPAPIVIVVHMSPDSIGVMDEIFDRAGALEASQARNGEQLQGGHVYVAPPDHHVMVERGSLLVTRGPRENRFRPAIDPLFRSAAKAYGPGAIGVVLTGNLDDGTAGLGAIKDLGGIAVVQDPAEAAYPSMPTSALRHVQVDYKSRLEDMGALLVELARESAGGVGGRAVPEKIDIEVKIAGEENPLGAGLGRIATPSTFACPECHGVLLQLRDSPLPRFRCHTGHAYSAEALLASIDEGIESSLWNAVRALEEGMLLAEHMATHATERSFDVQARTLTDQARTLKEQMEVVRDMLRRRDAVVVERKKTGT